ncbi:hypothetical protein MmiAt1_01850 [Methanimicrococcus sp. At1]|uniref:Teneurin-like YD-shell domain-containing protein n=2 Tax=Methanimicrococcus hacksteinii TaxID=3028293 RepID=A0ABU3VMN2_9EURY|nr:hypothetical protein [Methanimicrococcus sp. At1]
MFLKKLLICIFSVMILTSTLPLSLATENSDIDASDIYGVDFEPSVQILDDTDSNNEFDSDLNYDESKNNDQQLLTNRLASSIPSVINTGCITEVNGPEFTYSNDAYLTSLFSGAATYDYGFQVPAGIAGFEPVISLSYNSLSSGGAYGWLGDGWELNDNYIFRKVNYTPLNTTDDSFRLIFNGTGYDLIYNATENRYHTKSETYMYITKESGASNQNGEYWVLKTPDGNVYRFGYNVDSEFMNSVEGRNYVSRWYLDQVTDVFDKNINYTYIQNPSSGEIGATYLDTISYNNGSAEIKFLRIPKTNYFDIYEEGCRYKEMNLLSGISMHVNSELVRRYAFDYNTSANHVLLSSIALFGDDNVTSLPATIFDYYLPGTNYSNTSLYLPTPTYDNYSALGVIPVDLNGDGKIDFVKNTLNPNSNETWISGGNTSLNNSWKLPTATMDNKKDTGVRLVDLDGDGLVDVVQNSLNPTVNETWINTGTGFELNATWNIPEAIVNNSISAGLQFIDINGDGLTDIVQNTVSPTVNRTWINTGAGFELDNNWRIPVETVNNTQDTGVRFVDINGDGLVDIIQNSENPNYNRTWINTGTGFVLDENWKSPVAFVNNSKDLGVRLLDLNGDGLIDITQNSQYPSYNRTWLNTGYGFIENNSFNVPFAFTNNGIDLGVIAVDMNHDGLIDFTQNTLNPNVNRTSVRNTKAPYKLSSISHSAGSSTHITYKHSAYYNHNDSQDIPQMASKMWLVSSVYTDEGNTILSLEKEYNYTGGVMIIAPKGKSEFRGFNHVRVTTHRSIEHHYFHQDEYKKGLESSVSIIARWILSGSSNIHTYEETVSSDGVYNILLSSTESRLDGATIHTNYTYDNYGNILEIAESGDVTVVGDERKTITEYNYNTSKWILNSVKSTSIYDSDDNEIAKTTYYYDGAANENISPSKGLVTKVIKWNNNGSDAIASYEFDSLGNLITETDANGGRTEAEYSATSGYLYPVRMTNALNQTTQFEYDIKTGNLIKLTDPNGISIENVFDTFGRVVKVIRPFDSYASPSLEYAYFFDGNWPECIRTTVKEADNQTLETFKYFDGAGRIVKTERPGPDNILITEEIKYNYYGEAIEEIEPYAPGEQKRSTKTEYDQAGRVIKITNPDNSYKIIEYDGLNITQYDEKDHATKVVQDVYGNILKVIEFNGLEVYETNYEYDACDRLVKIIPMQNYDQSSIAFSNEILTPYFLLDSKTAIIQIGSLGANESMTINVSLNGSNPQNKVLFDFYDHFTSNNGWVRNGTGQFPWVTESIGCIDGVGVFISSLNSNMNTFTSVESVDISDGYVFYTRFDPFEFAPENIYHTGISNDNIGTNFAGFNVTETTNWTTMMWMPTQSYMSGNQSASGYSYSQNMMLYKIVYDASVNTTSFYYDNELVHVFNGTIPANELTSLYYKKGGRDGGTFIDYIFGHKHTPEIVTQQVSSPESIQLTVRNTGAETVENAKVEFDISSLGLVNRSLSIATLKFESDSPVGIPYSAPYKVANTTFVYDSLGQQIKMDDPDLGEWFYEYDANGNLIWQADGRGVETDYEFDALNRLTKVDYPTQSATIYEYDIGRIGTLSRVTSEIMEKEFEYDNRFRVINETITLDNITYSTLYEYDLLDRAVNITYPNNQTQTFEYDESGLLKSIPGIIDNIEYDSSTLTTKKEYSNGMTTIFEYDNETNRLKNLQTNNLQNFSYEFDSKGNIIKITDHLINETQRFNYDDLDRLVHVDGDSYSHNYIYNPLGCMLAFYDGTQLTFFEHGENAGIHAPTKAGNMSLYYDSNGNLIEDGNFLYIYDEANRLKEVFDKSNNNLTIAQYWYDESGTRIKKIENGNTSYYVNLAYNVQDGNETVYYFANGERVAKESSEGLFFYLNDYLGSTNVIVDNSGNLSEKIMYYPFGNPRDAVLTPSFQQIEVDNLFMQMDFTMERSNVLTGHIHSEDEFIENGLENLLEETSGENLLVNEIVSAATAVSSELDSESGFEISRFADDGNVQVLEHSSANPSAHSLSDEWAAFKNQRVLKTKDVFEAQKIAGGHKYYIKAEITDIDRMMTAQSTRQKDFEFDESEFIKTVSAVYTCDSAETSNPLSLLSSIGVKSTILNISDPILIDLTETFGEGNEPDVEWCNENIPYLGSVDKTTISIPMASTVSFSYASETYTFNGKEMDKDIGLYYYDARYYNPSTFTFTQADSIIPDVYNPQALNRYAYCLNNPVTYTDPDGHLPLLVTAAIGAAVGGLVAGGVSYLSQKANGGEVDMNQVYGAALGGAVAGGIAGLTLGAGSALSAAAITSSGGQMVGAAYLQATIMPLAGACGNTIGGMAGRATESYYLDKKVNMSYVGDGNAVLSDFALGGVAGSLTPIKKLVPLKQFKLNSQTLKEIMSTAEQDLIFQTISQNPNDLQAVAEVVAEQPEYIIRRVVIVRYVSSCPICNPSLLNG